MKLELKHLAPYLPYALKVVHHVDGRICEMTCGKILGKEQSDYSEWMISGILNAGGKPILRPLSDLTKEIEHNREKFVPLEEIQRTQFKHNCNAYLEYIEHMVDMPKWVELTQAPYEIFQQLLEWHFDVFKLIPAHKAIDINTINK